ncbi:MAG: ribosome silencing factor [Firmicutes bacterium]|nr:ribosome silencing factor [Bacillota bacterium]
MWNREAHISIPIQQTHWNTLRGRLINMNEPREKAELIAKTLYDKKGIDVIIIDISAKSSFADYFVIASGGSDRQVAALVENVEDLMEPQGTFPKSVEGRKSSGWILMDYGDVVVNIMSVEMRDRYNLEKVWGDCEIIEYEN